MRGEPSGLVDLPEHPLRDRDTVITILGGEHDLVGAVPDMVRQREAHGADRHDRLSVVPSFHHDLHVHDLDLDVDADVRGLGLRAHRVDQVQGDRPERQHATEVAPLPTKPDAVRSRLLVDPAQVPLILLTLACHGFLLSPYSEDDSI